MPKNNNNKGVDLAAWFAGLEVAEAGAVIGIGAFVVYKLFWDSGKGTSDANSKLDIDYSKLPDPTGTKYKNIADDYANEFNGAGVVLSHNLIQKLDGLTPDELKAVAKEFGERSTKVMGMSIGSNKNLFAFFEDEMSNLPPTYYLDQMKAIWKPSGIWN